MEIDGSTERCSNCHRLKIGGDNVDPDFLCDCLAFELQKPRKLPTETTDPSEVPNYYENESNFDLGDD